MTLNFVVLYKNTIDLWEDSIVLQENRQINLSENAIKVLEKRYLKRDADGNCTETPADMFRRVADTIASGDLQFGKSQSDVDKLSDRFYDAITNCYFMPNSPTLMNAGR